MPRERNGRTNRTAARMTPTTRVTSTAQPSLVSLLAHIAKPGELLSHLHQFALDSTSGVCSLLFQHNPRNGVLQATSGFALDALRTDPWIPAPDEGAIVTSAFERRAPAFVPHTQRQMPDLAARPCTPPAPRPPPPTRR